MKSENSGSPAQRAADWLVLQINADGSLRGATSINEYYKTVFALVCAGRISAADRMLNYVAGRFLKSDGDLDGTGCDWFDQIRIYGHSWVAMAAIQLARFDISEPILRFLETFHDERTGGFYGNLNQREKQGEQELMTTGLVAMAMLWGGRVAIAKQVARWMKNLWDAQPNIEQGLYFVWDHRRGLVTDIPREPARNYRVDAKELAQRYYQYGILAAFLSELSGAVREPSWLTFAQECLHASRFCREDVYRRPQSGKIGWGAAWTYRLSRDASDRAIIEKVLEGLKATQSTEGWWPQQATYGDKKAVNSLPGLDLTGEFIAHLSWMEYSLETAAISRPS
jgi:hypothetical protein